MQAANANINVLICAPNASSSNLFLPYVWAVLKSYYERHGSHVDRIEWLDPLFKRESILDEVQLLRDKAVDIVGLSCYTWNWHLNLEVARLLKSFNPCTIVIAGGPHPDYKDPEFFEKHPEIDAVVIKDGEVPWTHILDGMATNNLDFTAIPGLCLPGQIDQQPASCSALTTRPAPHLFTGNAESPVAFDHSPYLMQLQRLRKMIEECADKTISAILETNRGCPYSCNYCDWGSSTMSQIRKFDMTRVEADIKTLAALRVSWLYWADANVGILPRDIDIADLIIATRQELGYPDSMIYASAKNNPDRTVEIVRRLYNEGLVPGHWLALQHTDKMVLQIADRSNIPAKKYQQVLALLRRQGIPVYPQFILGMPGDTLEKWKTCVTTMMEWGMHEDFWIPIYSVLPNAPAANPEFLQTWQVETIERELIEPWGLRERFGREVIRTRIIISSRDFSRDDWVEATVYASAVQALHNLGITRLATLYLHATHGIPYRRLYDMLIYDFLDSHHDWCHILEQARTVYRHVLVDSDAVDDYSVRDYPDCQWYISPAKGIFIEIALRRDSFMKALHSFLTGMFPGIRELSSLIEYHRALVMSPDRDPGIKDSIRLRHDWPSYFNAVDKAHSDATIPPPRRFTIPRVGILHPHPQSWNPNKLEASRSWLKHILANSNSFQTTHYPHAEVTSARCL